MVKMYTPALIERGSKVNAIKSTIITTLLCVTPFASAWDLDFGSANSFNLFVEDTASLYVADSESRVAANTLTSNGFDIGACLHAGYANDVNTDCSFASAGVEESYYASNFTETNYANTYTGVKQVDAEFFTDAFAKLRSLSTQLSQLTNSFEFTNSGSLLVPDTTSLLNEKGFFVTSLSAQTLSDAWELNASALANNYLVVNVDLAGASHINGLNLIGANANQIIYNFYNAGNITFDWGNIEANILAPNATFTHNSGLLTGRVMVQNFMTNENGGAQLNYIGDFQPTASNKTPEKEVSAPATASLMVLAGFIVMMRRVRKTRTSLSILHTASN